MNLKIIKDKLWNKTWKKSIIIFIIIFFIVLFIGALSINYVHDTVIKSEVHPFTGVVIDKYQKPNFDHTGKDYFVVTEDGQTFICHPNNKDDYHIKIWNKIKIGEKYRFIVKEPEPIDINQYDYILQVYNESS